MQISKWKMWELLTCHGENAHHPADPSVAQQRHLHGACGTFPLFPSRLDGGPYSSQEDQQVEEDHDDHSGDVDSHGEAVDGLCGWSERLSRREALEGKQQDIPEELQIEHTPPSRFTAAHCFYLFLATTRTGINVGDGGY